MEELFAKGLFKRALIKVDLPTLLRPKKTISEAFGAGALESLLALLKKRGSMTWGAAEVEAEGMVGAVGALDSDISESEA